MIDINEIHVGDEVHYEPEHYGPNEWENGIVKEIPVFAKDRKAQVGYNCVRVVYNCGGNWHRYQEYTSALTSCYDLHYGWRIG